jgi:hypothetical protein
MTATPTRQMATATLSKRSGRTPSRPPPQKGGARDDLSFTGKDPPEVCIWLQLRHEAVDPERDDPAHPGQPAVFAHPLSHQPGAANLGERGYHEQRDRSDHIHAARLRGGPPT